jgi:predicted DNA-binding transcriptional regulator AlpA
MDRQNTNGSSDAVAAANGLAEIYRTPAASLQPALPPQLLRAPQAAAYCGVSEATWWRMNDAERIPRSYKPSPGVTVWSRLELDEWIALGLPPRAEFEARRSARANARPR